MKSRGKKIKFYKVAPKWIEENLNEFNYFAFLCSPDQHASPLAKKAESFGIELGIFKY
jgi:hypothetical protein